MSSAHKAFRAELNLCIVELSKVLSQLVGGSHLSTASLGSMSAKIIIEAK